MTLTPSIARGGWLDWELMFSPLPRAREHTRLDVR